MKNIDLREITLQNLDEVIDLTVGPAQTSLVADNLYSIAQAGLDPLGWCRAAYLDDQPVGFMFVKALNEGRNMYLCRFMVGHRHQGQGIGFCMMQVLLQSLFSSTSVDLVDLAVSREPGGAEGFYQKCGFTATDEPYRGGWRMVLMRTQFQMLQTALDA
ncbi:GNAT family N-acetyltransferase [Prosthecobacter sp.]|uniref:GNAT family N-acetyltransferase n=1 Tax=Prosthecobacter sp. TaxID=1965333 RepID=UPI002486EFC0|nr:GNAT family N-acetyltransferase [Prosthecobacter sp.]MDI1313753.1 GNAT family N-acetyltransferase [Prosthecobacter sp.]